MKKKTTTTENGKKTATPAKSPKKSLVKSVAEKVEAAAKTVAKRKLPAPSVTTIIATADIGWGNQLYLRGEGGGLSWDAGVPMTCNGADEWVWVSTSNDPIFQFKFVLNDKFWSLGENMVASRGETNRSYPAF